MDLQADVKAYLQTLTEEQRAAWMVNLQLSYASRTAPQASHSSEPSQSVASLPMTHVERRAEEPHRTWQRPDDQELAQHTQAPQPNALESSEEESGTTHQFHEHLEPSDHGSVQQPEEELTHEATAQHETTGLPSPVQVTEPPAPSAFEQYAPPADTTGGEPQPPTATVPQASAPAADTTTPVKARPPLPTALPCAQPTPPTEPKTPPEPSFHHPQPKVYHLDKNKQTHWLQPSDDDPTASASTNQPLPPATRPTRPPGSDVWWVAEPITNPDSPRHQPKPSGSGWVSATTGIPTTTQSQRKPLEPARTNTHTATIQPSGTTAGSGYIRTDPSTTPS